MIVIVLLVIITICIGVLLYIAFGFNSSGLSSDGQVSWSKFPGGLVIQANANPPTVSINDSNSGTTANIYIDLPIPLKTITYAKPVVTNFNYVSGNPPPVLGTTYTVSEVLITRDSKTKLIQKVGYNFAILQPCSLEVGMTVIGTT